MWCNTRILNTHIAGYLAVKSAGFDLGWHALCAVRIWLIVCARMWRLTPVRAGRFLHEVRRAPWFRVSRAPTAGSRPPVCARRSEQESQ
jgi:hypothetical protein